MEQLSTRSRLHRLSKDLDHAAVGGGEAVAGEPRPAELDRAGDPLVLYDSAAARRAGQFADADVGGVCGIHDVRLLLLEVLQRGGQPSPVIAFTAPELDADGNGNQKMDPCGHVKTDPVTRVGRGVGIPAQIDHRFRSKSITSVRAERRGTIRWP